jgi:hypothetical protein
MKKTRANERSLFAINNDTQAATRPAILLWYLLIQTCLRLKVVLNLDRPYESCFQFQ